MNSEFWKDKWKAGDIAFHRASAHPELVAYFSGKTPQKVVVPLCGKSKDLLWLYSQGHEVVGIELSPIACEAFFTENRLPFEKKGNTYQGDRVSIWCGDLFEAPQSIWTACNTVYDRAALVALPEEVRRKYAGHLVQNWSRQATADVSMLLITVEYESETLLGPPFSVTEKEVRALYGQEFNVELRNSYREPELSGRAPKFTGIEVKECSYEITLI